MAGLATGLRYKLRSNENLDLTPFVHWPEPKVHTHLEAQTGPVSVTIEYQIDPNDAEEFTQAARAAGKIKRRDGAFYWNLFRDTADPRRSSRLSSSTPGMNTYASTDDSRKPIE